jgi:hypothetical protein
VEWLKMSALSSNPSTASPVSLPPHPTTHTHTQSRSFFKSVPSLYIKLVQKHLPGKKWVWKWWNKCLSGVATLKTFLHKTSKEMRKLVEQIQKTIYKKFFLSIKFSKTMSNLPQYMISWLCEHS